MEDYKITMKVQNGWICELIEEAGYTSIPSFCMAHGLIPSTVYRIIRPKAQLFGKKGQWFKSVTDLAQALGKLPEDLFSPKQLEPIRDNKLTVFCSQRQMESVPDHQALPGELMDIKEMRGKIDEVLATLPDMDAIVIRNEFGLDTEYGHTKTMREIGSMLNVGSERARQIRNRGLHRLRNPNRLRRLEGFLGFLVMK